MRSFYLALMVSVLALPVSAGVVYEIEVIEYAPGYRSSPAQSERIEVAVEGKNLAMGDEAIYRGDQRQMVSVDHDERSFSVIDRTTMGQMSQRMATAMPQMDELLKNVPADQRALVEQMMKQRMPQQAGGGAHSAKPRDRQITKTSSRATKAGYPCVKYDVLEDGRKIRELWVTDWDNIHGGKETIHVFSDMAEFFDDMRRSMPMGGGNDMGGNMFAEIKRVNGFPVLTREFAEDGSLESESWLRSAKRRQLDPAEFEPPRGYRRRSL